LRDEGVGLGLAIRKKGDITVMRVVKVVEGEADVPRGEDSGRVVGGEEGGV